MITINAHGMPAPNMRFYESGGVTPPEKQCVIASASPAASSVAPAFIKPPTRYVPLVDNTATDKRNVKRKK